MNAQIKLFLTVTNLRKISWPIYSQTKAKQMRNKKMNPVGIWFEFFQSGIHVPVCGLVGDFQNLIMIRSSIDSGLSECPSGTVCNLILAREVDVPDYESMTTTDDSTLEPKPKKGTRRSRRKSCTDVKVQLTSYTNAFISPKSDYLGDETFL